jgi:hypothetical protein
LEIGAMPVVARFFTVKLRKWFPPDDPLAAKNARLCILREDFALEMHGVYTENIEVLDSHSETWRRFYFLRNLIRTLMEIQSGIQRLLSDKDFKDLLYKQSPEVKREFGRLARVIAHAHPILKEIRNDICGHVLESAVQEALEEINLDSFGFMEIGRVLKKSHFKFAGELVASILVKGVAENQKAKVLGEKMEKIADALDAFALVERILFMYAEDRGLWPLR